MAKIDRNNLEKLLNFIDHIIDQEDDGWFRNELAKRAYNSSNSESINDIELKKIRKVLQIRGKQSIDYSFIKHSFLREQLIIDNIRMENAALNLDELNEIERFYNFCVNAFYQVENLINFYYYKKYPKIQDLTNHIQDNTITSKYPFKKSGTEKNVGDISMFNKLIAFGQEFFPEKKDYTSSNLGNLRMVRNEGLHRCMVIIENQDKNPYLFNFFKYQNFTTVRTLLKKVVSVIKEELKEEIIELMGQVINVFPSTVLVKFENGETIQLQDDRHIKRNKLKKGDKISAVYFHKFGKRKLQTINLL